MENFNYDYYHWQQAQNQSHLMPNWQPQPYQPQPYQPQLYQPQVYQPQPFQPQQGELFATQSYPMSENQQQQSSFSSNLHTDYYPATNSHYNSNENGLHINSYSATSNHFNGQSVYQHSTGHVVSNSTAVQGPATRVDILTNDFHANHPHNFEAEIPEQASTTTDLQNNKQHQVQNEESPENQVISEQPEKVSSSLHGSINFENQQLSTPQEESEDKSNKNQGECEDDENEDKKQSQEESGDNSNKTAEEDQQETGGFSHDNDKNYQEECENNSNENEEEYQEECHYDSNEKQDNDECEDNKDEISEKDQGEFEDDSIGNKEQEPEECKDDSNEKESEDKSDEYEEQNQEKSDDNSNENAEKDQGDFEDDSNETERKNQEEPENILIETGAESEDHTYETEDETEDNSNANEEHQNLSDQCDSPHSVSGNSRQETGEPENESEATCSKSTMGALKLVNLKKIVSQKPPTPPISNPVVWFPVKEEPLDSCDAPAAVTPEESSERAADSQQLHSASRSISSLEVMVEQLHTNVKLEPVSTAEDESRPFNYGCQIKVERTDSERVETEKSKFANEEEQESFEQFSLERVKMLPADELTYDDADNFKYSNLGQMGNVAQLGVFTDPEEKAQFKNATIKYATERSLKYYDDNIPHFWSRLKTQRKNGKVERFDVYYYLNTPCGIHMKFRSRREIQDYLDNVGETMISGENFEFHANSVPHLPTPTLQAFDTSERQASLQLFIQNFLANPQPIFNLPQNPVFNKPKLKMKEETFILNCTLITEEGRSQWHDQNVPQGWMKTIQKSPNNMSTVSFTHARENLMFHTRSDVQSYLEAICEPFLSADSFDFRPNVSFPPPLLKKKKKKKVKPMGTAMPLEAGNSGESLVSPARVLAPPLSYQSVSGADPILTGLLKQSNFKKEIGNQENGSSEKTNDPKSTSTNLEPLDSSSKELAKEAHLADIKNYILNLTPIPNLDESLNTSLHLKPTTLLVKSPLKSKLISEKNIQESQPSTSANNTPTLSKKSSKKKQRRSADPQIGTVNGQYQPWNGSLLKEMLIPKQEFPFNRDNNLSLMGQDFPNLYNTLRNPYSLQGSSFGNEKPNAAVKKRPREDSEIEPLLTKHPRIGSENETPQLVQIVHDDGTMVAKLPRFQLAPKKKPDTRDRVPISEFLSCASNYSPDMSERLSGNVKVQVHGGLDYIIHDETIPGGWEKCCKSVPNQLGIFTTSYVSQIGAVINSRLKMDQYLAVNTKLGLAGSDFDFKSTPTFPRNAKILARSAKPESPMPTVLDLLGTTPKNEYYPRPADTSASSSNGQRSNQFSTIAPSSSSNNDLAYQHATGASLLSAALSQQSNLNRQNLFWSNYFSARQNIIDLQNGGKSVPVSSSNSQPEVIDLDDDDDDVVIEEQSDLMAQIQNEIALKGNQVH